MDMTNTILYAVIADEALCQNIQENLSDDYALSIDGTLVELLERVEKEQPHIILCGQSFLERDYALVLAMLKTASPISSILAIGASRPIEMQVAALKHGARGYFDVALPMPTLNAALGSAPMPA